MTRGGDGPSVRGPDGTEDERAVASRRGRLVADGGVASRAVIEAVPDAIVVFDDAERVVRVNPAFESLFGVAGDRIEGRSLESLADSGPFVPRPAEYRQMVESLSEGEAARVESRLDPACVATDGGAARPTGERTIEARVAPLAEGGSVVTLRDVTARRRTTAALEGLHETAQAFTAARDPAVIAETAVDASREVIGLDQTAIYLYDERTDRLEPAAATDAMRALLDELPTFSGGESIAWQVYETGEQRVHTDVRNAPDRYRADTEIRSEVLLPLGAYGVFIVGSTQADAFADWQLSVARVLAADTTRALERAAREAELRARQTDLERQNDRLDAFASIVSHDLRNPLNVAAGNLELAEADSDRIAAAEGAIDRAGEIVDDVLTMAREGQSVESTEPVDLSTLAKRCWATVATENARLAVEDAPTIRADPSRLRHLLENLFANSVEHGGDGRITVTVGRTDGGFVVADDGVGLPDDDPDFGEEFDTSTTGLGLAIVRQMADAHGWQVRSGAADDGGARFEITGVAVVE